MFKMQFKNILIDVDGIYCKNYFNILCDLFRILVFDGLM